MNIVRFDLITNQVYAAYMRFTLNTSMYKFESKTDIQNTHHAYTRQKESVKLH